MKKCLLKLTLAFTLISMLSMSINICFAADDDFPTVQSISNQTSIVAEY